MKRLTRFDSQRTHSDRGFHSKRGVSQSFVVLLQFPGGFSIRCNVDLTRKPTDDRGSDLVVPAATLAVSEYFQPDFYDSVADSVTE